MRRNMKRNIVIAAVLVFVGAAVYLNWSYNSRWGTADAAMVVAEDAAMAEAEEEYLAASAEAEEASVVTSVYFDEARLSRQSSRDEALELLELACASDDTSQEVIDASMEQINAMAAWNLQEALVENELLAKGYADCIVFASDDGITVAVPAPIEGLTSTQVAQITEAVMANTDYAATDLNIIEVTD
ncbi:MAG: SpoIIIAH-like family protein [Oscillospiraceae bacterium]|nr:SpoIIIAH-like family protein [Oscillospiraceae bacterium]